MAGIRVVDLRSDTVTKPTSGMRKAIYEAEVGGKYKNFHPQFNCKTLTFS